MDKLFPLLLDFFKTHRGLNMNYLYHGDFTHDLTNAILSFAENSLDSMGESTKIRKRVYFIMVESLQNITRHQESREGISQGFGYFNIQGEPDGYYITSCNKVLNSSVANLRSKLDMVNSLDAQNLKSYSAEMLQAGVISEKGGAGLGLIEMAKRSGNKLKFHFETIDSSHSCFYFQIRIGKPVVENFEKGHNLGSSVDSHKLLKANGLNIVFQGNFSQENVKSIVAMIEGSFSKSNVGPMKKKMLNLLIELLQNIYKHGSGGKSAEEDSRPGIFAIGVRNNKYFITSGSLIAKHKEAALTEKINAVNQIDPNSLEKLYAAKLLEEDVPGAKGAGLGFIDMRLRTGEKIDFSLLPFDNEHSFLTLGLSIKDKIEKNA